MISLRRFLDLRPEERRNTFAAFGTLLAITTGHTLLETSRDALFLSKVPVSQLPWMYLIIVVLALAVAQVRKVDGKSAIVAVLLGAAAVTAEFWVLAHDLASRPWVLYALYVWSGLFASWITVQFWTLLGRAHTMTQAKRLYGFIGAGSVLGGVVGAFGARLVLAFVGPRSMLLASASLFIVAAIPVMILRLPAAGETAEHDEGDATSMMSGGKLLWENAFARSILGIGLLATISFTLTDFLFKSRIAVEFTDTRELAAWLSTFNAVTNTVSLVAQLVIGPWIFRTFGVQRALFFFPVLLLTAAGGVLATGGRLAAAVLMKAFDGTLRYSVHKTSTELLLVPVPDGTRERIKPIIELVGTRGGQALASLLILFLVAIGAAKGALTLTVASFVVILTVAWLAVVVRIRGHYLDVFRETLRSGGLSGKGELPDLDIGALEMLFAGLNSSRDIEVLASLELLAEQHRERLIPALILYHPGRDVVLRALEIFTHRGRADFVPIADRLNAHPDREVAAAALRARTAVAPDRKLLEQRLVDPCLQVSATALISLMARGWIDAADAKKRLADTLATRSWQTAAELARALRDIASDPASEPAELRQQFDDLLIRLAREANTFHDIACAPGSAAADPRAPVADAEAEKDGASDSVVSAGPAYRLSLGASKLAYDVSVRLEVARAMAVRKNPAFLPVLVGMLARHELRSTARAAIKEIPGALEAIDEVMRQHDFARDVRVHLPRTMILFDAEAAAEKLMSHMLVEKDGAVRFKILRALVKLRRKHPHLHLDAEVLLRAAERVLDHAEELRRWGGGLKTEKDGASAAHHLLLDLVHDKECHAIQRLFMLLGLIHREDFEDVERGLRSRNPKTRANSLELVENIVRTPLRNRVLALVGEEPLSGAAPASYEEVIHEVLVKGSTTMRTLAEYRALELGIDAAAITGLRPSQPPTIESIGRRLVDRARDLLIPTPAQVTPTGASRAPA